MKRKIALLLACLLISCAAAGCGGSDSSSSKDSSEAAGSVSGTKDTSEASSSGKSSASETKTESGTDTSSNDKKESGTEDEGSEDVVEATFDENGNLVFDIGDPDEWEDEESDEDVFGDDGEEDVGGTQDFISSYMIQMLSPADFKAKEAFPVHYIITSEAELDDFIAKHSDDYALKVEYTGDDFIEKQSFEKNKADDMKKDIDVFDYILVVAEHSKSIEPDVGSGIIKDNSVVVDLWLSKPASDADKGYSCIIVPVEKGFLNGKKLSVMVVEPPIDDEEQ